MAVSFRIASLAAALVDRSCTTGGERDRRIEQATRAVLRAPLVVVTGHPLLDANCCLSRRPEANAPSVIVGTSRETRRSLRLPGALARVDAP